MAIMKKFGDKKAECVAGAKGGVQRIGKDRVDVSIHRCCHRERGAAMLITLVALTLLVGLGVLFSYTSVIQRRAADTEMENTKAQLLASSAMNRVRARLQSSYEESLFAQESFYRPDAGDWAGRGYLATLGENDSRVAEAFAVNLKGSEFVPDEKLHDSMGWEQIRSKRQIDGEQEEVIIGRVGYLIIDVSDKLDPEAVVSSGGEAEDESPETGAQHTRAGESVKEIALSRAGFSPEFADQFRPSVVEGGQAGKMPEHGWRSFDQMVKSLEPSESQMQQMVRTLFPYSYSADTFWRDADDDGEREEGESEGRFDLSRDVTAKELYNLFVGPDPDSKKDDVAWLKNRKAYSSLADRRKVALRTAVNIVDYADEDSKPTPAHVTADGTFGKGTDPEHTSVYGTERTWGVSQIAWRLKTKVKKTDNDNCAIAGDLNCNPNNAAWKEFQLYTPQGVIIRDTLLDQGADFQYNGSASKVRVQPKAQGRTLNISGQSVRLHPGTVYTIESSAMEVHLRNTVPGRGKGNSNKSMGHWWIDIDAEDASITPDPGVTPSVNAFVIKPAFQGEVFYPFATDAMETFPPGKLTVSYTVDVELERVEEDGEKTEATESYNGEMVVPLSADASADGGTICYSAGYNLDKEVVMANFGEGDEGGDDDYDDDGDSDKATELNYRIKKARIRMAQLKDKKGDLADTTPVAAAADESRFLSEWEQDPSEGTGADGMISRDETFYAGVAAKDALANDPAEKDEQFSDHWDALPGSKYLNTEDQGADIGGLSEQTKGYASSPYCDVEVKNSAFSRIGELGRVHSYRPGQSLRLWSADASETDAHDADILALFTTGSAEPQAGRVNINSTQKDVLKAFFSDVTTVSADAAAQAVTEHEGVFTNRGQVFGDVAGISGSDPSKDRLEEQAVAKLAELATVNQHIYTAIVCAQTVKDVGGMKYDSNGDGTADTTAAYNQWDVVKNADGEVTRHVDKILAENRIKATLRINPYTKKVSVVRMDSPFRQ
mgnify:CR=1 FL=1